MANVIALAEKYTNLVDRIYKYGVLTADLENDVVECDYFGEAVEIGFNYKYLHDAVSRCEGDEIELKMNSPFNPLIINSVDDESCLFMVLPVRI